MSNGTLWSETLNADSNGWNGETLVHQWGIADLTLPDNAVTQVRVTFQAGSDEAYTITNAYIGHKAAAGDRYDFSATPVQLLFSGSGTKVVAAGTQEVSDWATFSYNKTSALIIAFYGAGGSGSDKVRAKTGLSATIILDRKVANDAATVDKSSYSGYDNGSYGIAKIEADGFPDAVEGLQSFDSINVEAYIGAGWVSLNTDVMKSPAPKWNMGIMDNSPTARTGDPEYFTFCLANGENNAGGLLGYYTPGHANCLSGWNTGLNVRLYFVYEGVTFYKYYGKIMPSGITTSPFNLGARVVQVQCHGFMAQAAEHDFALPELITDVKIDEAMTALLTNMPIQPLATAFETDGQVFPTGFDTVRKNTHAIGEIQKWAMSEFGYAYTKGDMTGGQTFVVETRQTRAAKTNLVIPTSSVYSGFLRKAESISDYILQAGGTDRIILSLSASGEVDFSGKALLSMSNPSYGKNLANEVKAVTTPREVDAAATTVLFKTQERIELAAGQTKTWIRGEYRDDTSGASNIAGIDMVSPPTVNVDYNMYSNANGTGTDLTAYLDVTAIYGTEAVLYDIENTGTVFGYVYLQARGRGVKIYDTVSVVVQDATSIAQHGLHSLTYDMKYQNNPAAGQAIAERILAYEKDPTRTIEDYPMLANKSGDDMLGFLYAEPGERATFAEPMNAIDGDYFIMGYEAEIVNYQYVYWSTVLKRLETTIEFDEYKVMFNQVTQTADNFTVAKTVVVRFEAGMLDMPFGTIEEMRFTFEPMPSTGVTLSSVYVGHAADSGDEYDFLATPVQVLNDVGGATFDLSGADNKISGWAAFAYDKTRALLVSFRMATDGRLRKSDTGDADFLVDATAYTSSTNEPSTVNKVGTYDELSDRCYSIILIETQGTDT